MTTAEIAGILFEDREYDRNLKSQTNVIMNSLKADMKKRRRIEDLYLKTWNHLALDVSKIQCDAYDFMKGDPLAVNSYNGEYIWPITAGQNFQREYSRSMEVILVMNDRKERRDLKHKSAVCLSQRLCICLSKWGRRIRIRKKQTD